jgi:hypothetical protein
MKKTILIFMAVAFFANCSMAQSTEDYGNTLNIGVGLGYYGYVNHSTPAVNLNYELNVARNFTLAPFVTFFSYKDNYYHQTVIPIGVKGTYYFDQLLEADSKWDFYGAGSLGFSIIKTSWENNYSGPENRNVGASSLYLDLHIGTEYHLNNKLGVYLDLSTGISTIGLAIH